MTRAETALSISSSDISERVVSYAHSVRLDAGLITSQKDDTWRYDSSPIRSDELFATVDQGASDA